MKGVASVNWQPIKTAPFDRFVLLARASGYVTTRWEYLTGRQIAGYKGWTDVSNDRLTESGSNPLFWAELPNEPV